jgi:hypothetical protein
MTEPHIPTLRYCIELARRSAAAFSSDRAHPAVAKGALEGFAEVLEEVVREAGKKAP